MKYLCQVWFDTAEINAISQEEGEELTRECIVYDNSVRDSGHLVIAQALREPSTAVTVRVSNGKVAATDGPFAEIKEHLGGIILIDAKDMDEAIRIASGFPVIRYGCIEVRPAYSIQEGD
jgi:hypothetical protein